MYLIPYIYEKKQSMYPVHLFHIFLINGTLLLQVEESEIEEFCNTNELFYKKKTIKNNYCYVQIDTDKTNLNSFYFYTENVQHECFRLFILVGNYNEDFLNTNDTNPEFIKPVLQTILEII